MQLGYIQYVMAAMAAYSMLSGKKGQGGAEGGTNVITSTNVQVSPQISPQFIQQQSPSNSPINAGITGSLPGFDAGSGYLPTGLPVFPSFQSAGQIKPEWIMAGLAGIFGVAILLKKKRKRTRR